jgi:archaellin
VLHAARQERGQIGMEIALIGVVCATCVLGGVVIANGEEASQQLDSIFRSGVQRSSGTLVNNGTVVVMASGTPPIADEIILTLSVVGRPGPVPLDYSMAGERLAVAFSSQTTYDPDVPYTATEVLGDGDGFLEPGETVSIRVPVSAIGDGSVVIGASSSLTLQISAPFGGVVEVSRTMPFALDRVNALR